jgi:hypothetical protein
VKQYTPLAQIKNTLPTQPGITYAQITKQNSSLLTNVEQEPQTDRYAAHHTNHPAGTAQSGNALIIKNCIKHRQLNSCSQDFVQTTDVSVEDSVGHLTIAAVYLPPRHTVKQEQFEDLGRCFIAGGDYNAKHTSWGSRLISFKGHELLRSMESSNLKNLSMSEPTYWLSDVNNLPDLVDFCAAKRILQDFAKILFRPILRSFPELDCTNSGCTEPRKRTSLKQ